MSKRVERASVAAARSWTDPDGFRTPAGEVHAWLVGTNQTLCGLSTKRSQLTCFPHVDWADVQPVSGRDADRVADVCPRCAAAMGRRRDTRPWTRTNPRP
ncbi:MAG TPA: hypothetical protein VFJ83_05080 [Nocardioidaceae bacterium]|nr:hypothetical protein [Nocardioidaceae bacterium]